MANYNKVILLGNITRDPELRYTPNGTAVAHVGLAVNRNWRSQDGEDREETCFVDLTAWGRRGEIISEYKSKGDPLLVEGRLRMESWQNQEGQRRTKHVVVVENFQFLGRSGGRSDARQSSQEPPQRQSRESGSQGAQQPSDQQESNESDDSFGGDDIPF